MFRHPPLYVSDSPLTHTDEDSREHRKAHELDRFPAPLVNEKHGGVVSGNQPPNSEDDVTD